MTFWPDILADLRLPKLIEANHQPANLITSYVTRPRAFPFFGITYAIDRLFAVRDTCGIENAPKMFEVTAMSVHDHLKRRPYEQWHWAYRYGSLKLIWKLSQFDHECNYGAYDETFPAMIIAENMRVWATEKYIRRIPHTMPAIRTNKLNALWLRGDKIDRADGPHTVQMIGYEELWDDHKRTKVRYKTLRQEFSNDRKAKHLLDDLGRRDPTRIPYFADNRDGLAFMVDVSAP